MSYQTLRVNNNIKKIAKLQICVKYLQLWIKNETVFFKLIE